MTPSRQGRRSLQDNSPRVTPQATPTPARLRLMNMQIRPAIPAHPGSGRSRVLCPEEHMGNAQRPRGGRMRGGAYAPADR